MSGRTIWLEEPLSVELTTAELMADLDAEWATWEPDPAEAPSSR